MKGTVSEEDIIIFIYIDWCSHNHKKITFGYPDVEQLLTTGRTLRDFKKDLNLKNEYLLCYREHLDTKYFRDVLILVLLLPLKFLLVPVLLEIMAVQARKIRLCGVQMGLILRNRT